MEDVGRISISSKQGKFIIIVTRPLCEFRNAFWFINNDGLMLVFFYHYFLGQPEEEAHVVILSTCPCERDLHYVITTDGRVTDWAQRRYEDPVPPATSASTSAVCRLNFRWGLYGIMVIRLMKYHRNFIMLYIGFRELSLIKSKMQLCVIWKKYEFCVTHILMILKFFFDVTSL